VRWVAQTHVHLYRSQSRQIFGIGTDPSPQYKGQKVSLIVHDILNMQKCVVPVIQPSSTNHCRVPIKLA
jgi:hypothetical protein